MPGGGMSSPKRGKEPASGGRRRASEGQMPRGMPMAEGAQPGAEENGELERVLVEMRLPRNLSAAAALAVGGSRGRGWLPDRQRLHSGSRSAPDADRASALAANDEQSRRRARHGRPESEGRARVSAERDQGVGRHPHRAVPQRGHGAARGGRGHGRVCRRDRNRGHADGRLRRLSDRHLRLLAGYGRRARSRTCAQYLGVDQIWAAGIRGDGMVVGIVDGGHHARWAVPIKPAESGTPKVGEDHRRLAGGGLGDNSCRLEQSRQHVRSDRRPAAWQPKAQVYDIRISDGSAISDALQAFQWAIDQHRANGTPQVLSNSWGMFQESWDRDYATNPDHPFTRKVVEALDEGILVLFAAGNCGGHLSGRPVRRRHRAGKEHLGRQRPSARHDCGRGEQERAVRRLQQPGPGGAGSPRSRTSARITHFTGLLHQRQRDLSGHSHRWRGVVALLKQSSPRH